MSAAFVIGIMLIGILAGFMSSLVGIGGGLVIVPALVLLFGLNQKEAQGTSLLMLSLPVAFVGAFNYYKSGHANWKIALLLASTFMIGGFFGSKLAIGLEMGVIKKIFAVFMIIIAVKYLFFDK
ncbi:MAG: sulfite exporter TauE/SafE family protein [Sphingobacteriales bacterium]|nr:MAG: sulfite exporter TauE/SafE family protein [Sphingobacteriales bacterium]